MTNLITHSNNGRTDNTSHGKKVIISLDILLAFLPVIVFGVLGITVGAGTGLGWIILNLAYVFNIIVITGLLKFRGSSWREIGLARPESWLRTILFGIAALMGAILVMNVVEVIFLYLPGLRLTPPDISHLDSFKGDLPTLIIGLMGAWTTITFGEELFYRAFLVSKLGELFVNNRWRDVLAVVGSATAFGLVHYPNEGPMGIISNGAFGLLFGVIYLKTKRNLWITIIAHGLLNTLRFVALYFGVV